MRVTIVCLNDFPVRVFEKKEHAEVYKRVNHRPEKALFIHLHTFSVEGEYWTPRGSNYPD